MKTERKITIALVNPLTIILFLAFFFAKIYDKIDWSWWWVFSPLWIPTALIISIFLIIWILYLILLIIEKFV